MACDKTVLGSRLNACAVLRWTKPAPETLVASTANATSNWGSADAQWRAYSSALRVLRCKADIPQDQSFRAGIGPDPCPESQKTWASTAAMILRTARWSAPVSNDDYSPLTDLAGFHVSVSETLSGPWRLVASPTGTSVQIQVTPAERCVSVLARTTTGIQGEPRMVCVNKPAPVTDLVLEDP